VNPNVDIRVVLTYRFGKPPVFDQQQLQLPRCRLGNDDRNLVIQKLSDAPQSTRRDGERQRIHIIRIARLPRRVQLVGSLALGTRTLAGVIIVQVMRKLPPASEWVET
jgi:hypothetical protein